MTIHLSKTAGRVAISLSLALMLLTGAATAQADDHRAPVRHDRDWDAHQVRARHYHVVEPVEPVVYAPPVIYSPPPVESGINLIIPLNFH